MKEAVFPSLKRFDRVSLDTETNGLVWGSVATSLAVATPDGKSYPFIFDHPSENNCSRHQVHDWLREELKTNPKLLWIMLNAVYDMRVMKATQLPVPMNVEDVGIVAALLNEYEPGYTLEELASTHLGDHKDDTMLLGVLSQLFGGKPTRDAQAKNFHRAPGSLIKPYVAQDASLTLRLYDKLHPQLWSQDLMPIYTIETQVIPVLYRMYLAGVRIDVEQALKTQKFLQAEGKKLEAEWISHVGPGVNTNSTQQLARIFDRFGIEYKRTKLGNPSITKDLLENLDHPIGMLLRKMRQYEHYAGTFINNYLLENIVDGDIIHPSFWSTKSPWGGTITGRFSSSGGLNAQNIPARDEFLAPLIRGMFIPMNKKSQWAKFDYSQIEYRFFAHYAGGDLRDAYLADAYVDFHEMVAEMTGLPRKVAKNINFGTLYGMGRDKAASQLGVSLEQADEFLATYHARIPAAKRLTNGMMNRASRRGYVITWGGRRNRFRSVGTVRKKFLATHTALNKVLQGSSADLIKKAMVDVDKEIDWQSEVLHLTVHDELDMSIPKGKAGMASAKKIKTIMQDYKVCSIDDPDINFHQGFHPMTVPIIAEAELGPDWGHTEKVLRPAKKAA